MLVVFGAIALYDLAVGGWLLWSAEPWRAHGPGTIWTSLAKTTGAQLSPALESLFRRLGALQCTAAALTIAALLVGARRARVLDAYLVAVTLVGGALAWTDQRYFAGTAYHALKQGIGAVATSAMLAWLAARLHGWHYRRAHPGAG